MYTDDITVHVCIAASYFTSNTGKSFLVIPLCYILLSNNTIAGAHINVYRSVLFHMIEFRETSILESTVGLCACELFCNLLQLFSLGFFLP